MGIGRLSLVGYGDAFELSLDELLSEDVVVAMMQADGVTVEEVYESFYAARRSANSATDNRERLQ